MPETSNELIKKSDFCGKTIHNAENIDLIIEKLNAILSESDIADDSDKFACVKADMINNPDLFLDDCSDLIKD